MPVTYWTALIGSLALIGFPGFSGFFSKDAIIEAVHAADLAGAGYAYALVLAGVFITALYSFRMFFLVFHGKERFDEHTRSHLHETPAVVTGPLVMLAVPSVIVGWLAMEAVLFGGFFGDAIHVDAARDTLAAVAAGGTTTPMAMLAHGFVTPALWLALGGVAAAWFLYLHRPELPGRIAARLAGVNRVLDQKYYFDAFNERVLAPLARGAGQVFWRAGDGAVIDGLLVNGSARAVGWLSGVVRRVQTGYLYHYAFAMFIGLALMLGWLALVVARG
jgi:NADH-quinone oxidoreductase subunit L